MLLFSVSLLCAIFALSHAEASLPGEAVGWGGHRKKGVYLTLCALLFGTSQPPNYRQGQSNGRCPSGMLGTALVVSVPLGRARRAGSISAWASALLVLTVRAMRRPQTAGRVTGTATRAFFVLCRQPVRNGRSSPVGGAPTAFVGTGRGIFVQNRNPFLLLGVAKAFLVGLLWPCLFPVVRTSGLHHTVSRLI